MKREKEPGVVVHTRQAIHILHVSVFYCYTWTPEGKILTSHTSKLKSWLYILIRFVGTRTLCSPNKHTTSRIHLEILYEINVKSTSVILANNISFLWHPLDRLSLFTKYLEVSDYFRTQTRHVSMLHFICMSTKNWGVHDLWKLQPSSLQA